MKLICTYCGGEIFFATKNVNIPVVVDGDGNFLRNRNNEPSDGSHSGGDMVASPVYQCCGCGAKYRDLRPSAAYAPPIDGWHQTGIFRKSFDAVSDARRTRSQRWDTEGYYVILYQLKDGEGGSCWDMKIIQNPSIDRAPNRFSISYRHGEGEKKELYISPLATSTPAAEMHLLVADAKEAQYVCESIQREFITPLENGVFDWDQPVDGRGPLMVNTPSDPSGHWRLSENVKTLFDGLIPTKTEVEEAYATAAYDIGELPSGDFCFIELTAADLDRINDWLLSYVGMTHAGMNDTLLSRFLSSLMFS